MYVRTPGDSLNVFGTSWVNDRLPRIEQLGGWYEKSDERTCRENITHPGLASSADALGVVVNPATAAVPHALVLLEPFLYEAAGFLIVREKANYALLWRRLFDSGQAGGPAYDEKMTGHECVVAFQLFEVSGKRRPVRTRNRHDALGSQATVEFFKRH